MTMRLEVSNCAHAWCDRCMATHGFADIVSIDDEGVSLVGRFEGHVDAEFKEKFREAP